MAIERFEDIEAQNSQESAVTSRYLNTKRVDRLIGKQGQATFSLGLVKKQLVPFFSLDAPVSSTGQAYQVRHDGMHRHSGEPLIGVQGRPW